MNTLEETVLIVEDEFAICLMYRLQIEELGLSVCGSAATAAEAIRLAKEHRPAAILMDVRLQGKSDGVDAALAIHDSIGSKIIFNTGSREPATLARIQLDHAEEVLFKPLASNQLQSALRKALSL